MSSSVHHLKERIKAEANTLGFCVIGFSAPEPLDIEAYNHWLSHNYHAGMKYLATDDAIKTHQFPANLFPQCKTIISLGALYTNPARAAQKTLSPTHGKIASYALGEDYHQVLQLKIEQLIHNVSAHEEFEINWMSAIDTKPIAERTLANKAGLGWIAKNSMLTNPIYGSALFLCEIFIDVELQPDEPFTNDFCGTCTRCIDACPTNCILSDRTIDSNQCLSYLTIEHRGVINESFFDAMNPNIFGCDICLQVCPWNKKAKSEPVMNEFNPENQDNRFDIPANIDKILKSFHRFFEHSAIRRAGKQGFLRNCIIRLSQNQTEPNAEIITRITSSMPDSYLTEQKQKIDNYQANKKGS